MITMVKVTYYGNGDNVRAERVRFKEGESREVSKEVAEKIAKYPGFHVEGIDAPEEKTSLEYTYELGTDKIMSIDMLGMQEELKRLNRDEQIKILKRLNIKGYSKWDEPEIIQAILDKTNGGN